MNKIIYVFSSCYFIIYLNISSKKIKFLVLFRCHPGIPDKNTINVPILNNYLQQKKK